MGGYDGNVLFENLELSRTVEAAGGREHRDDGLFVRREPPTARQFRGQRVRQAYDSLAQPSRMAAELALLPATLGLAGLARSRSRRRRAAGRAGLALGLAGTVALAERGRRRAGGREVFPATAALWAPVWLAERAVCAWLALGRRLSGGVPVRRPAPDRRRAQPSRAARRSGAPPSAPYERRPAGVAAG